MAGLYSTLNSTVSAMNVESLQISTAGTNLANVNNPNYAEETVNVGSSGTVETPYGAESTGLTAESVTSLRDALLDSQVRESDSSVGYYNTLQSAYQAAQSALGQTVSASTSTSGTSTDGGLNAAITNFFDAFQSYATSPTDVGQQQQVLAAASVLTSQLQSTDQGLAQVQSGLSTQAATDVTSVNSLLGNIASLNGEIAQYEGNSPGSAVSLRDQRESDLEQLSGYMPVSVTENAAGEDQVSATDASGNPVVLVNNATVTGPVTLNGSQVSAGSPATVLSLSSGSIQGALDASSGGIQTLRNSLNQLASQLVTSVNAVYDPSGTGGNFFNAANTTAGTISLDPALTATNLQAGSSGASGDNSLALGIANLANNVFSTAGGDQIDGTFSNFYANAVSGFGQTLSSVNDQVSNQTNIQSLVTSQRESVSGVSLDQEMASLLMYQRSYQASGQVFQTVDSLIDTVINSLGTLTT
jgi:flagellar hook-associated protein 1 FlgK